MQFQKSTFLLNQMMSLFFTTNPTYIHEINIFQKDYLDLKHLKKFSGDCKLEHLKIVRNGHQHTWTTENEEVF